MEEDLGLKTGICLCFYFLRRERLEHISILRGESVDREKAKIQEREGDNSLS